MSIVLYLSGMANVNLFTCDVELINLSSLKVLMLHDNYYLNGSLPLKGKNSIIHFLTAKII